MAKKGARKSGSGPSRRHRSCGGLVRAAQAGAAVGFEDERRTARASRVIATRASWPRVASSSKRARRGLSCTSRPSSAGRCSVRSATIKSVAVVGFFIACAGQVVAVAVIVVTVLVAVLVAASGGVGRAPAAVVVGIGVSCHVGDETTAKRRGSSPSGKARRRTRRRGHVGRRSTDPQTRRSPASRRAAGRPSGIFSAAVGAGRADVEGRARCRAL